MDISRTTVVKAVNKAKELDIRYEDLATVSDKWLAEQFSDTTNAPAYEMPKYDKVYREMQKSGFTLNLCRLEYCEECHAVGKTSYQLTQFKKYYRDYLSKKTATMHPEHKPGEAMQVDWAGDTASVIDTDTGEMIPA